MADPTTPPPRPAAVGANANAGSARDEAAVRALAELDARIQTLAKLDWPRLRATDPPAAQAAAQELVRADALRAGLVRQLQALRATRSAAAAVKSRREGTRRAHAEIAAKVPDWGEPLAAQLAAYAGTLGFTQQELDAVTDPRLVIALHRAWRADQADGLPETGGPVSATPAAAAPAAVSRPAAPAPLTQVGRRSSGYAPTLSDSLPVPDWIDIRRGQVRNRRPPTQR